MRSAENRLKAVFTSPIEGAAADMNTLSAFGVTTTREGSLEINHQTLNRQLEDNFHTWKTFSTVAMVLLDALRMQLVILPARQGQFVPENKG